MLQMSGRAEDHAGGRNKCGCADERTRAILAREGVDAESLATLGEGDLLDLELAAGAPPRKPPRGDRERARGGGTGGSLRSGTGGSSAGAAWGGGTLGTGGRALDGMLMAEAGRRAERRGTNTIRGGASG